MDKKEVIKRITEKFPQELQVLHQWVVWRIEDRGGKLTKVPYSIDGTRAASDNPATWTAFDTACNAYLYGNFSGIGFMFSVHDPYTGIDFDKCIIDDEIDSEKLSHIELLDSYTERSQSGTGIHVIVRALLPPGGRKSNKHSMEMYDQLRFFVVTGDHVDGTPLVVNDRQDQAEHLHAYIFPAKTQDPKLQQTLANGGDIPQDDQELLKIMFASKPGGKIESLWNGNTSGYANDESSADQALCNYLAFWTGNDAGRMDRLFRQSGLYRDKWDRPARTGEKYGEGTIARAIAITTEPYKPKVYTNGTSNGTGAHTNGNGHQAPQAKTEVDRRPYVGLLDDMKAKASSLRNDAFIAECLYDKEEGDARLLDYILHGSLVYDHTDGVWYWYNNLFWEPDETWNIYQLTSDVLSEVYKNLSLRKYAESIELEKRLQAEEEPTQEQRDELKRVMMLSKAARSRAVSLNEIKEVKQVLSFANSGLRLGIKGHEWDTRTDLLCTQNTIINLKNGLPVPPDPSAYIRTVASINFDADAICPVFEKSILEIFDGRQDDVDYVQRLLGYAMAGECIESDFPIWYGEDGRNGKEFILERIRNVLGEKLTGVVESELLLASKMQRGKNSSTEGLMVLRGRRIAWASETNEGRSLDLASMKDLSGGHVLTGRHNHGKQVEWKRTHTLILLTNHRPHVNSQALAEWDRVKLLEFPLSFVNEPDPAKPNQRLKDKTLGNRIDNNELPGVLNWLITGNLAWRAMGLSEPESVKTATAQYRVDEDSLGHFIKECCLVGENLRCKPVDLYRVYAQWTDIGSKPMGKKTFYTKIEQRNFHRLFSVGIEYFTGIGILA